ncbi:MAG: ATP synthase F0 subunit C [Fimbriimonadaceae bacterium]|nr:ATP synthase F0 subunit C [Fimbriimonadaceae bacterium]
MNYGFALALGVTFGLPLAVAFASHAQAKAAVAALDGIAKQPEAAGKVQTAMIIALALIESLVIYVLLSFFMLNGKVEKSTDVLAKTPTAAVAPAAAPVAAPVAGYGVQ